MISLQEGVKIRPFSSRPSSTKQQGLGGEKSGLECCPYQRLDAESDTCCDMVRTGEEGGVLPLPNVMQKLRHGF